jgi:UDP-N-acetyl-D-glucosamine dehydrogenase
MTSDGTTLQQRISQKAGVKIAIIGIGYVGLPLAVELAKKGFSVIGVDINKDIVEQLKAGNSIIEGLPKEQVRDVLNSKALTLLLVNRNTPSKTDPGTLEALVGVDVFIVCVPTPLHSIKGWEPDTAWIDEAAKLITTVSQIEAQSDRLPQERLVVLESTTYPGTTRELFTSEMGLYEAQGKRCYLAYSPERTSPGPKSYGDHSAQESDQERPTFQITRIVGGVDESSKDTAVALYEAIFNKVHPVESLEAAEMIKLVENTFRFISIGFANEMARIARSFGLNIWDIIEAAKTKKFGLDLCFPGLIGGHCIPIDPHYLGWKARHRRQVATFVDVAESAHQYIKRDALDLIQRLLRQHDKGLPKTPILFFGVAYKKNVGDIRESAAMELMKKLYIYGSEVHFWDPVRARYPVKQRPRLMFSEDESRLMSPAVLAELVQNQEGAYYTEPAELIGTWEELRARILGPEFSCVVIATDHDVYVDAYADLLLADGGPLIADLRNALPTWLRHLSSPANEKKILHRKLDDRSKYMLLGVHLE